MGESLSEDLIFRGLSRKAGRGYLKFPAAFKDRFSFDGNSIRSPAAYLEERNGKIRLIFEWNTDDLNKK